MASEDITSLSIAELVYPNQHYDAVTGAMITDREPCVKPGGHCVDAVIRAVWT
jgi:hypothetical protein